MLKNSESARATTIAASPPIIAAWVMRQATRNFGAAEPELVDGADATRRPSLGRPCIYVGP